MKSKIFYAVVLGFLFGNIAESRLLLDLPKTAFISLLAAAIFIFTVLRIRNCPKVFSSHLLLAVVALLAISLGSLRFEVSENLLKTSLLAFYEGQNIQMIGVVLGEPIRKTDLSRVGISLSAISTEGKVEKISKERINVYIDFFQNINYGDLVVLEGRLERIKNREDGNFDFKNYAKKDGVQYQIFRPKVSIQKNVGNPIILKLKSFKNFFESKITEHLSEPHAALLSGMLISGKGALPQSIQDEFIRTGLIHIVVLSGFNIAIIIKFLNSLFSLFRFNKKFSIFLILASLFLFVLMAGATPPVIRAVLMASIVLMGKATFRQMDANKVLMFVAFILALINPYSAPFDPSFQLSFLATFAIINFTPIFEHVFKFIKNKLLKETVSQTLAATIFVSPFVLYLMGNFSVVAIFVNILLLPLVPMLMLFGFLVVALSFIPIVPTILAFLVIALSSILFAVVHFASSLPFASFNISNISIWWIIPVYIALFIFMYKKRRENPAVVTDLTLPH